MKIAGLLIQPNTEGNVRMKIILKFAVITLFLLNFGAVSTVSASIINGSLTGPIANGGLPTGWTTLSGSPDTMDENNNVAAGTPFGIAPSGASPDGGTWVGMARNGDSFSESFGQTVSGLLIGTQYDLSWYGGNFGAITGPGYTAANALEVLLDLTSIGSGGVLNLGSDWFAQSLSFTATSTSHNIAFRLLNSPASYMSIDGIALNPRNGGGDVPAPATLALLGLGLAGLGWSRRKKA